MKTIQLIGVSKLAHFSKLQTDEPGAFEEFKNALSVYICIK